MRMSFSALSPLLCVACFLPVARAGEKWYKHDFEYNFVETIILIGFVIIALAFEHVWHWLSHIASSSYRYGVLHDQANNITVEECESHGSIKHLRLYKELVTRAGGEFMTLGVLAFIVFIFNNAGGFEAMEDLYKLEADLHLPRSKDDWLHMVEVVHMKLFVGMILYFYLIGSAVRSSATKIRGWENCRLRRVKDLKLGRSALQLQQMDVQLSEYLGWRDYFIERVVLWQTKRPKLYFMALDKLDIDIDDPEAPSKLRKEIDEQFAFSAYLSLNVSAGLCDSIHVHQTTWGFLLLVFALFAVLHRYAKVGIFEFTWIFIALAFFTLMAMGLFVAKVSRKLKLHVEQAKISQPPPSRTRGNIEGSQDSTSPEVVTAQSKVTIKAATASSSSMLSVLGGNWHQRFPTEAWFLRIMQIVLFLVSYVFARTLIDFHDWEEKPQATLLTVSALIIIFILLTHFLYALPTFLALMSLPPYVDDSNLVHFFDVLLDNHMYHAWNQANVLGCMSTRDAVRERSWSGGVRKKTLPGKVDELCDRLRSLESGFTAPTAPATGRAPEGSMGAVWSHLRLMEERLDDVARLVASKSAKDARSNPGEEDSVTPRMQPSESQRLIV